MIDEVQVARIMKGLGVTREEALAIYEDDKRVDKGEHLFELTAEQKKVAKKYTTTTSGTKKAEVDKKPTAYKFDKRERKTDEEKKQIIAHIYYNMIDWDCFGEDFAQCVSVSNPERMISFNIGENRYEITLTKKRK